MRGLDRSPLSSVPTMAPPWPLVAAALAVVVLGAVMVLVYCSEPPPADPDPGLAVADSLAAVVAAQQDRISADSVALAAATQDLRAATVARLGSEAGVRAGNVEVRRLAQFVDQLVQSTTAPLGKGRADDGPDAPPSSEPQSSGECGELRSTCARLAEAAAAHADSVDALLSAVRAEAAAADTALAVCDRATDAYRGALYVATERAAALRPIAEARLAEAPPQRLRLGAAAVLGGAVVEPGAALSYRLDPVLRLPLLGRLSLPLTALAVASPSCQAAGLIVGL